MKREEILAAMRRCAEELGRTPSRAQLIRMTEIRWHHIFQEFGGMRPLAREAGLAPVKRGLAADPAAMVLDWARVARELGRLPGRKLYDELGRHSSGTLHARLNWGQMPHRFLLLVWEYHLEKEWGDVMAMVLTRYPLLGRSSQPTAAGIQPPVGALSNQHSALSPRSSTQQSALSIQPRDVMDRSQGAEEMMEESEHTGTFHGETLTNVGGNGWATKMKLEAESETGAENTMADKAGSGPDRAEGPQESPELRKLKSREAALYGAPLDLAALAHAPTNEHGVTFLFGVLAERLRFRVERLQSAFPDCLAKREVRPGAWELVRIEFEFESRNFRDHRHDPAGCDVIVCWRHNWPECPKGIEVVELEREARRSPTSP